MKALIFSLLALLANMSTAEEIQTTDGRTIILHEDNTFDILGERRPMAQNYLEVRSHVFRHHTDNFQRRSIRFMPIFRNRSDRAIAAVKFTTWFYDPFGNPILHTEGQTEERMEPGSRTRARIYYAFNDNQYIKNQPYDRLLHSVLTESATLRTEIRVIAFADGEVMRF